MMPNRELFSAEMHWTSERACWSAGTAYQALGPICASASAAQSRTRSLESVSSPVKAITSPSPTPLLSSCRLIANRFVALYLEFRIGVVFNPGYFLLMLTIASRRGI